jgi:hypothetical protein
VTCLTCETTPPPEKTADRAGPHHIGQRFGDGGLGLAVLFRGQDWTLQTVEAMAGDEETGWVEVRIVNNDGTPTIHGPGPVEAIRCPSCGTEWPISGEPVDRIDLSESTCPDCDVHLEPVHAHGAHVVTVLRRGHVQIIRGTEVISGPVEATDPMRETAGA